MCVVYICVCVYVCVLARDLERASVVGLYVCVLCVCVCVCACVGGYGVCSLWGSVALCRYIMQFFVHVLLSCIFRSCCVFILYECEHMR